MIKDEKLSINYYIEIMSDMYYVLIYYMLDV